MNSWGWEKSGIKKKIPPLPLKKNFSSQLIMRAPGAECRLIWVGCITLGGLRWKVNKLSQFRTHLASANFVPGEGRGPADRGHDARVSRCRGAGRTACVRTNSSSADSCTFYVHLRGSYPRYIITHSHLSLSLRLNQIKIRPLASRKCKIKGLFVKWISKWMNEWMNLA